MHDSVGDLVSLSLVSISLSLYDARLVSGDSLRKFNARCKMGVDGAKRRARAGGRLKLERKEEGG